MRFLYVDEAGTSAKEPITVVAGVIIHADAQWRIVEAEIDRLLDEYVPSELRGGFVFHAWEIFHCNTNRDLWRNGAREELLKGVVSIPKRFQLPICVGAQRRGAHKSSLPKVTDAELDHLYAMRYCVSEANALLAESMPLNEVATIVVEDVTSMREAIMSLHDSLKHTPILMLDASATQGTLLQSTQFVDAPHFAKKNESPMLQLADACAFTLGRWLKRKSHGEALMGAMLPVIPDIPRLDELRGAGFSATFLPWLPVEPDSGPEEPRTDAE